MKKCKIRSSQEIYEPVTPDFKFSRFSRLLKLTFDFTVVITNQRLFSLTQMCQLMITELEPTQIWKQGPLNQPTR